MQTLTMIKNQLKLLVTNRFAVFAVIAAPLLLTFLFSFSVSNSNEVYYIADLDQSTYSNQLIQMVKDQSDSTVILLSESELKEKIDNGNISMGFVIENNFGTDIASSSKIDIHILENYETGDGSLSKQTVLSQATTLKKIISDSQVMSDVLGQSADTLASQLLNDIKTDSSLTVQEVPLTGSSQTADTASTTLIGFLVMFLWFVMIQGFRTLVSEKENGTFERIFSTPTNYIKYLITKIIATYLFGVIITAVILASGKYIFQTNILNNQDVTSISLVFAIYLFALTGIVMVFVPFMKRQQSFTILGSVMMTITGILGGSFFSIDEIASGSMKLASKFTPEYWAIHSITDLAFNNASLPAQALTFLVLGATGITGFFLSYLLLKTKVIVKAS